MITNVFAKLYAHHFNLQGINMITIILLLVEIDVLIESSQQLSLISMTWSLIFLLLHGLLGQFNVSHLLNSLFKCLLGSTVFIMFGHYSIYKLTTNLAFYFFQTIIISSNMFSLLGPWNDLTKNTVTRQWYFKISP